jgi:thiamine-phosphate pyrophosphorylase
MLKGRMPRGDHGPLLYLVMEATAASADDTLRAALGTADVVAVLLAAGPGRELEGWSVAPLVATAQAHGAAALVEGDARLARTVKADGVHVPWSKTPLAAYTEAREIVGARAMIGGDAGRSRHDAMQLGEAGADYIGFGIPAHVEDRAAAAARRLELVAWWSEIFEIPVVAFDVATTAEASALAAAGADFVAARVPSGRTATEVQSWVREMAAALAAKVA